MTQPDSVDWLAIEQSIIATFPYNNIIVAVISKRQLSRFSLRKNDLFPLFWVVIYENRKIIWLFVLTSTIYRSWPLSCSSVHPLKGMRTRTHCTRLFNSAIWRDICVWMTLHSFSRPFGCSTFFCYISILNLPYIWRIRISPLNYIPPSGFSLYIPVPFLCNTHCDCGIWS